MVMMAVVEPVGIIVVIIILLGIFILFSGLWLLFKGLPELIGVKFRGRFRVGIPGFAAHLIYHEIHQSTDLVGIEPVVRTYSLYKQSFELIEVCSSIKDIYATVIMETYHPLVLEFAKHYSKDTVDWKTDEQGGFKN